VRVRVGVGEGVRVRGGVGEEVCVGALVAVGVTGVIVLVGARVFSGRNVGVWYVGSGGWV